MLLSELQDQVGLVLLHEHTHDAVCEEVAVTSLIEKDLSDRNKWQRRAVLFCLFFRWTVSVIFIVLQSFPSHAFLLLHLLRQLALNVIKI